MRSEHKKTFRAVLEADGTSLRWTLARVPFDIAEAWPERKGRRVRGTISRYEGKAGSQKGKGKSLKAENEDLGGAAEGFAFRTSLFPDPAGAGHVLVVNAKMRAGAGVRQGDRVEITMEPDLEELDQLMTEELARALKEVRGLRKYFDAMSRSHRREMGKYVSEPKSAASRVKRAEQMAERLALAMEGEKETPPILRAAFQRQARAEAGWKALTPLQRRNHLLGIFYYQTAEARERRAQAAIEDALRAGQRKSGKFPA